jgi:hypothetical protein
MASDVPVDPDRYRGLAALCDACRPRPPAIIPELLARLARTCRPRLVGFVQSLASFGEMLRRGCSEAELGLDALRAAAQRTLGDEPRPWVFSYAIRIGIR